MTQSTTLAPVAAAVSERTRIFNRVFASASTQALIYNPEWNNGTGYFDGVVYDDVVQGPAGSVGCFTTPGENNRRVLVLKTDLGNVAVFERFSPGHGPSVYVSNKPREIETLTRITSAITDEQMFLLFGGYEGDTNFGARLAHLLSMPKDEYFISPWEMQDRKREAARARLNPENVSE